MIAPHAVAAIRLLLAGGDRSHRQIARHVGISRATVAEIAQGRRPDYPVKTRKRHDECRSQERGPLSRCPGCGGRVLPPCRLCHVRQGMKSSDFSHLRPNPPQDGAEALGPDHA